MDRLNLAWAAVAVAIKNHCDIRSFICNIEPPGVYAEDHHCLELDMEPKDNNLRFINDVLYSIAGRA